MALYDKFVTSSELLHSLWHSVLLPRYTVLYILRRQQGHNRAAVLDFIVFQSINADQSTVYTSTNTWHAFKSMKLTCSMCSLDVNYPADMPMKQMSVKSCHIPALRCFWHCRHVSNAISLTNFSKSGQYYKSQLKRQKSMAAFVLSVLNLDWWFTR